MRVRFVVLLLTFAGLAAPTAAAADCVHVVAPGESLTSIAAADGLSVDQLASANGLSPTTFLLSGSCLTIPPQGGGVTTSAPATVGDGDADGDDGASTPSTPSSAGGGSYVVQPGDTLTAIAARAGMSLSELAAANGINPLAPLLSGTVLRLSGSTTAPAQSMPQSTPASAPSGSSYVVQPGDTLTAIAARAGMSLSELAAANGINPLAPLLSGTVLHLSGSGQVQQSASSAATSQPVGAAAEGSPSGPPYPTPETLSAGEIGSIAASEGVPPALAEAIAWQESGFNNDLTSSADARGIMQILPGTWNYIGQDLATPPPLGTASAAQNVRAGTLLLHSLLQATGGNQQLAAAGYFQGLPSVEQSGLYPQTQQYVNDVMSLEQQFGGG